MLRHGVERILTYFPRSACNILVHEYIEIDLGRVAAAGPLALGCYHRYVQQVTEFVSRIG